MHSLNTFYIFSRFYYFFFNFNVFFFDERGDCDQAGGSRRRDDLSRGGVPRGGFGE